ncbi:MAG: glycosyltransferase family 4 protein [Chitinophagaceae bacterium]
MRVLHITSEYPPVIWGGLGTAVGGLTKALSRESASVGVLLVGGALVLGEQPYGSWNTFSVEELKNQFTTQNFVRKANILFFHVSLDATGETADLLSDYWVPEIIHLHTAWLLPVAQSIREKCHCPIVFTVHSIDKAEYEVGKFFNHWDIQERAINESDSIIAISKNEKELLAGYYPHVISKISVAGNGIAESIRAKTIAKKREWKTTGLTVLYTGRFVDRKGIRELISAIPQVLSQFPEATFVLAGGYGGAAEIQKEWLADALGPFKDRIIFTGWLTPDEVNKWYERADILVIPSWYEPFGMVVLEGMLYGLPIVATNVGGPAEILVHNVSALLIPPKNVDALKKSILDLLRDAALRKRLGESASKDVRDKWLWNKAVKKIQKAYADTIIISRVA